MKDSFLFFSVECVNGNCDSAFLISLIPVIDGNALLPELKFFFNPEAPFEATTSGMEESYIKNLPSLESVFPTVKKWFSNYSLAVASADGYSARALFNTLERLGVAFEPVEYVNAKAVIRKLFPDMVSYSMSFLNQELFGDYIQEEDTEALSRRWLEILLKGLDPVQEGTLRDFVDDNKIKVGKMTPGEFVPARTVKKSHGSDKKLDVDSIKVYKNEAHPLFGKKVVFTGKLECLTRNEARTSVIQIGGEAPENLTKDTDYLVVGVQDLRVVGEKGLSGKMKKAAQFREKGQDIEIIDEKDFLEMMKTGVNFG